MSALQHTDEHEVPTTRFLPLDMWASLQGPASSSSSPPLPLRTHDTGTQQHARRRYHGYPPIFPAVPMVSRVSEVGRRGPVPWGSSRPSSPAMPSSLSSTVPRGGPLPAAPQPYHMLDMRAALCFLSKLGKTPAMRTRTSYSPPHRLTTTWLCLH